MTDSKCSPTTPVLHARLVQALPFSLATTRGIIIIFFSSPYLDVSVQEVGSLSSDTSSTYQVVPFGNLRILCLCAAPRSLSQLTTSFIASQSQGIHHTPFVALKKLEIVVVLPLPFCFSIYNLCFPNMSKNLSSFHPFPGFQKLADVKIMNLQAQATSNYVKRTSLNPVRTSIILCGEYRSRTDDPLRARQMLWPAELTPQGNQSGAN